jgi:predicted permease
MMRALQRVWMALRSLLLRRTTEQELDDELRFHLAEMQAFAQGRQDGAAPSPALGLDRVKEACRDARTLQPVEEFLRDLRIAGRRLRKNPGFALTAVATIALGIGANLAIFTLVNAVLLRPLPAVRSPHDLVLFSDGSFEGFVAGTPEPGTLPAYSYPLYQRLRDELRLFDGIAAQQSNTTGAVVQVPGAGASDGSPASGRCVSANYFDVLGIRPLLGRTFQPEEDDVAATGAPPVMVLSHGYWQRRFGGAPSTVGSALVVNGVQYTVIGITPEHFTGTKAGAATDFWVPITMQPQLMRRASMLGARDPTWWLLIVGRSKQGVSIDMAEAEANGVVQRFLSDVPAAADRAAARSHVRVEMVPGARGVLSPRRQFGPSLLLLMGGVGLLLLIAGMNVSHLLLTRYATRQAEVSLELALGATRTRIMRRLATEGFLLAALGGAAGLVVGRWSAIVLIRLASTADRAFVIDTSPDVRLLTFAAGLILATSVLFSLVPIRRASIMRSTRAPGTTWTHFSGNRRQRAFSRLFVILQVALSLLLLVGAGLLVQSLRNLQLVDKGFREDNVLLVTLNSRLTGLTAQQLVPIYEDLLDRVSSLPVQAASMAIDTPLSGNTSTTDISIPGRVFTPAENVEVQVIVVTPRYFETMGMPVLEGRSVGAEDRSSAPHVAVINEAFARRFFDSDRVLARRFRAGGPDRELTVVGVVKNARVNDLRSEPGPVIYLPLAQSPGFLRSLQVRAVGEPARLAAGIRQIIRETNPKLVVTTVSSLHQQVDRSLVLERLMAALSGAFGIFALVLVCVGLYGVLSQIVLQRTAEIGVRVALGATRHGVQWLVLRESLLFTLLGIAFGLPAALAAGQAMAGLLFGLGPVDARILLGAAGVVAAVAAAASYIPARRASRIDPIVALRHG